MFALIVTLFISACKKSEPTQYLPPPDPAPPPEMKWDVQADFDVLTPFVPQQSLHTRLHEGSLPELTPSNQYGMLLPYSSAVILENGSLMASKFGFVTVDGVVITDLVYDGIYRAESASIWHIGIANKTFPAYSIYIDSEETGTNAWVYRERKMAVCALDGSWITPFDYVNIAYTEDVILLARDHSTFDIDVIDYNGNHLYNTLDHEWANNVIDDAWAIGSFMGNIAEGYGHVQLKNNTVAFIDVLTGNARYTDFASASVFNDGLISVAVRIDNNPESKLVWGFINTNLELVIPLKYEWSPHFFNGRAIVQDSLHRTPQQVIDRQGNVLFTVPDGYSIDHSYDGSNFVLYNQLDTERKSIVLNSDFKEIIFSDDVQAFEPHYVRHLENGWFILWSEAGSLLINEDKVHFFPGIDQISYFDGEFMVYTVYNTDDHVHRYGIMTLDGRDILQPEADVILTPVVRNDKTTAFIASRGSTFYFYGQEYKPSSYKLFDTNGSVIIQGFGILTYHENLELYSIQGTNHFSWLDRDANPIIIIPLLSSTFD